MNSVTTGLITSGVATFTGRNTRISFVPDVSVFSASSPHQSAADASHTSSAASSLAPDSSSLSSAPPIVTQMHSSSIPSPAGAPVRDQFLQTHQPPPTSRLLNPNAAPFSKKQGKSTTKKKANISPENAQIDYLTTELNYTHTKIVSQDNVIKDLEHRVKILTECLRISEEKLNSDLHKKYFGSHSSCTAPPPRSSTTTAATSAHSCSSTPCPGHHSCHPQSCDPPAPSCNHDSSCPDALNSNTGTKELDKLAEELSIMKVDILQIKTKLESLTAPPVLKHPRISPGEVPEDQNLPENRIVVEADIHTTENSEDCSPEDISTVSIDEIVPDILPSTDSSPLHSKSSNMSN